MLRKFEHTERARNLRIAMNHAERKTWRALRAVGEGTLSFRRQHPVAGFYLDFYCAQAKLALELDGSSHENSGAYDARRDRVLAEHGIKVLRVPNHLTDEGNASALAEWFAEECLARIIRG